MQRVAKNTSIVIAGEITFKLISLVVMIYLARDFGTTGFGKYNFVFAYLTFFDILTDFGLQQILVREIARNKTTAPVLIGNAFIIRLMLAIFSVFLSLIIISFMSYPADTTTYVYIASFALPFTSFSYFYATVFQAELKIKYAYFAHLTFRVLSAGLILWIIFSHGTLLQIMFALLLSQMVRALVSYFYSRKFVRQRFEIDFEVWKYLLKESLPLALSSVIWVIYYETDKIMLSMMMGDSAVGLYSAAYNLFNPVLLIPSALTLSLFPVMSASFKTSRNNLMKSYALGVRYLLIIMLPIAMSMIILADKIIMIIYGIEFAYSTNTLQILTLSIVFGSVNSILLNLLVSIDRQNLNAKATGLCATINVILNFLLIPILGVNGAAIATVATNVVLFAGSFYFVSKYLQVLPVHKIVTKPLIGCIFMGAFMYYFVDANIFLLVPLAAIVYLVALLALKSFAKEDWDIFKKIVSRV